MAAPKYNPSEFETRWSERWVSDKVYAAPERPGPQKKFVMEMFPYPSGDLHMGHVENYAIGDVNARYWRMRGFEVIYPIGYDAFGLPAENAAIKKGIHPREYTKANIEQMRASYKRLGCSYDWDREVTSCEPEYYRWNQWIFLQFYRKGLAYRSRSVQPWCPVDKTVLAKEQFSTGVCWRCGSEPEFRELDQWFLKVTDYSDALLDDMKLLDWPASILRKQEHWIGRSHGALVTFKVRSETGQESDVEVFTTRPDTLWGATFLVLAAEHPVASLLAGDDKTFKDFATELKARSEVDRMASKEKTGLKLPGVAINPATGEEIPVWCADYVLMSYGTGAVMGVPAHDSRDLEFAQRIGAPVRKVIEPAQGSLFEEKVAYTGVGTMINSGPLDGTFVNPQTREGIDRVIEWLAAKGKGRAHTTYRQRDWIVGRQRYWGTPIPIVHCDKCGMVAVREDQLPVLLPDEVDYSPAEGDDVAGPLALNANFVNTTCPDCGGPAKRDTDTLDTFFDSSWYFLRYTDPKNTEAAFDPAKVAAWHPVDLYVGGTEHAVMHLIYARFFIKFFRDLGLVNYSEPFLRLFNQGSVTLDGQEMSSSSGHNVPAWKTIEALGADAARTFILGCGPPEADYDFPADGMGEIKRVAFSWLSRVWRVLVEVSADPVSEELERSLHRTIKAVTRDMDSFGFNTAIARLHELINDFYKLGPDKVPRAAAETLLKLLAPIAPFVTEELWSRYGYTTSIHIERWPAFDESKTEEDSITIVVQIDGKVRDTLVVSAGTSDDELRALALASPKVSSHLNGAEPSRVILVPRRLVNIVL